MIDDGKNSIKISRRSIKSNARSKLRVVVMQTSHNLISEIKTSFIAHQRCWEELCNFKKYSNISFTFSSKTALNISDLLTNSINHRTPLKVSLAFLFTTRNRSRNQHKINYFLLVSTDLRKQRRNRSIVPLKSAE